MPLWIIFASTKCVGKSTPEFFKNKKPSQHYFETALDDLEFFSRIISWLMLLSPVMGCEVIIPRSPFYNVIFIPLLLCLLIHHPDLLPERNRYPW